MRETGTVVSVNEKKNTAAIRFNRTSACGDCKMCAFKDDAKHIDMSVENTLSVAEGDMVEVELKDSIVIVSAVIAYAIPVLLAGLGLLIGTFSFENEIFQFLLCLGFLILGYIIIVLLDRKFRITKRIRPVMLRVVKEDIRNG